MTDPAASSPRVRDAAAADFASVMALYRQLQPDDPVLDNGEDQRVFDRIVSTDGLSLQVLEVDARIVATTYLNIIPNLSRSAAPYAVVENVVVHDELRGTGLGKEIMAATLAKAWAAGCYKVMLMTGSRRESTLAFYRSCGMRDDLKTAYLAKPPHH